MNEFKNEIDRLKRRKAKRQSYKTNKKDVLENAKAFFNGLNIIIEAFENRIFQSKYRPEIDVDNDLRDDQESNLHVESDSESYGLTDKELQMFKNVFRYQNPEKLRQTLIKKNMMSF